MNDAILKRFQEYNERLAALEAQEYASAGGTGVTSVGLALPSSVFSVSGSPVTGAGILTGSFINQAINKVFASPASGSAGLPDFRSLVPDDLPYNYVTDVSATTATPLDVTRFVTPGPPHTISLQFSWASQVAHAVFAGPFTGTSTPVFRALIASDIPALAYVTSVALTAPSELSVAGSPITSSGTLALSWASQTQNKVFASPNGSSGTPSFRTLVSADLPAGTGTVTSVALSLPSIFSVSGSPVTTSGTLTGTLATQTANTVLSGPTTGAAATPTFRSLVSDDIPNLSATKITSGILTSARGGTDQGSYTTGDMLQYSSAALTKLAAVATGNVLLSGGVATINSWGKVGLTTHVSGTLAATNGGTDQSSYTVGDLLYASSTTALSKLAAVAVGKVLRAKGTSTAPAWEQVDLSTDVTGTLPAGNGGTGQSSYTTGDLLYASSSSALSKLADVATGNALISGGTSTAPSWGKIGMTTHVGDYYTGTWTPAFIGTTIAGTFTYTTRIGRYRRIDDMVWIVGRVRISAISVNPTGNIQISGLPYTVNASVNGVGTIGYYGNVPVPTNGNGDLSLIATSSGTVLALYFKRTISGFSLYPAASFTDAAADIIFSVVYTV